jgi:hypothetical protein
MTYAQYKAERQNIVEQGLRDFAQGKRSNFTLAKSKLDGLKAHYKAVKRH